MTLHESQTVQLCIVALDIPEIQYLKDLEFAAYLKS